MNKSKFGKFVFLGALTGATLSMLDRATRQQFLGKSRKLSSDFGYYSKNPQLLKYQMQEKAEKIQTLYEQIAGDATYIKKQVEELKTLTPQVKDLVVNTKEAFVDSKDEVKAIVNDSQIKGTSPKK